MAQEPFPTFSDLKDVKRHQPLVTVLAAATAGIVSDRFLIIPLWIWCALGLAVWLAWLFLYRARKHHVAALLLLICVTALAGAWHHFRWHLCAPDDLGLAARAEASPVCVEGIVHDGPRLARARMGAGDRRTEHLLSRGREEGDQTRFVLRVQSVRDGRLWQPASGKAWVVVDGHLLGIHAGDRVRLLGHLVAPQKPANPGDFDSAAYHRRKGRLSVLQVEYPDGIERLEAGSPLYFWRIVEGLRAHCENQLHGYLSRDRLPLAEAILLGAREQLDVDEKERFRTTGTIHLMAISGLHVGILVSLFILMSRVGIISTRWAMVAAVIITLLYAFVADPRPPVMRATILTWMMCLGWWIAREAFSFNALAAAGLIVLALNPSDLFNAGAQLSFLAVGTLASCAAFLSADQSSDPLKRLIAETRPWPVRVLRRIIGWCGKLTLASLIVWLVSMPLVAYYFHVVTPVAALLTPLLWIPVTVLLYCGFGVIVFGWLLPPIAIPLGWMCDGMLWLITACVDFAHGVPASHAWVPGPPLWWIVVLYALLLLPVVCPALKPPRKWCWSVLVGWVIVGVCSVPLASYWSQRVQPRLACTFVSVGHGASVLLELPDGRKMLYDAGGMGSPRYVADSISAVLWSRGIRRLDAVVLSHADTDHYNAVPRLLDRFAVDVIYVSPHMLTADSLSLQYLHQAAAGAGVPIQPIVAGDDVLSTESTKVEVLYPLEQTSHASDNENSVVLLVEYANCRILLPGDLEGAGMVEVLASPTIDCDIVMAPHHGRPAANPVEFYDWSHPRWVVVSSSLVDDVSSLVDFVEDGQRRIFLTARSGAISVVIGEAHVDVRTWQGNEMP